jgi:GTP pyrophosphokinase
MVGARVNGKLVPIEYRLRNGDRIEIITSQNARGPSRDWLKIVKSTQAKNKINQWFRKELKEDNIERGKDLIAQNIKAKGFSSPDLLKNDYMEAVMQKYGFRDWESVLAAVGHGGLKEGQIVNKLIDIYNKEHVKNITDQEILDAATHTKEKVPLVGRGGKGGIVVEGLHDLAVHFAKCCSPIPGDEIVGYVTRGRGVTVHRTDCTNIMNMSEEDRTRLIEAEWLRTDEAQSDTYEAEINIYAQNRTGLLVDISRVFTERKIDIGSLSSRANKQGTATLEMSFQVHSKDELGAVIAQIRKIPSVIDVTRKIG